MITCLRSKATPRVADIHGRYLWRVRTLTCTRLRSFSGSTAKLSVGHSSFIPEPTWSIRSLKLDYQHKKLPPDEVKRLAHLALLDLDQLPNDLEQDLANMMHMVEQVSSFVADPSNKDLFTQNEDETGTFQYDFVRGVTSAPFRSAQSPLDAEDLKEAAQVWRTYLEPSTTRRGGAHQYFSISTKELGI